MNTWNWMVDHPWSIEIGAAFILLFFLHVVLKRVVSRSLEHAILPPAKALLLILLASFLFDLLIREFQILDFFSPISSLRNAGVVGCLSWFLLRWKKVAHHAMSSHLDPFTLEITAKIFTILTIFVTLIVVMQIFGFSVLPLITFGGIGAATLGFAGKDAIANFFGGLMIYMTRPFMRGDLIALPERNILGYVEEIGWYLTSIRDEQKKPIYVPNSVFSTEPVVNQSRITHRRIEEIIKIRAQDLAKLPTILEQIRNLFNHHPAIERDDKLYIFLENLVDHAIQIEIKAYVLRTRYEDFMAVRQEILLSISDILEAAGAETPHHILQVLTEHPARV